jgi:NodT family efflux transporter outer membrane factor (OMF) lipoprotein
MKKLILSLLPIAFLACRPVGPTYTPEPQRLPEAYGAKGGTMALESRWWETLGDPQLNGLIQQALAHSPDLRVAEARLRQSRALLGVQEAAGGPQLAVTALVSKDRQSLNSEAMANLPFKNVENNFTNHQIAFDASWELDLFGHTRRQVEAAGARADASAERLRDAGLVLSAEVARNYIDYRTGQRRLALAQENQKTHEETVRLVALQVQAGETTQLEAQRAMANRRFQKASLDDILIALRQNLSALSSLTDLSIAELESRLGEGRSLMAVPQAPAPGLPSDLLKRRPDLRATERDLAAANADVGVAVADQYPRFSLVGSGGWTSVESGNLLTNASRMWSIGPQMHLPLFQSGRLRSQVKANEAAYEAASATYRKAVLSAVADVEVALTRMARSEERRQQLEAAVAHQEKLVALTELQLKAGEVSKIAFLESQRSLIGQEDQALQAHSQSLSALVSLCKAMGGGWMGRGND